MAVWHVFTIPIYIYPHAYNVWTLIQITVRMIDNIQVIKAHIHKAMKFDWHALMKLK